MQTARTRVLIIGGGVAGLSAGAALDGFDVTVLEAESQPGYHSSGRSAAVYIEAYENDIVWELTVASRDYHEELHAEPISCISFSDVGSEALTQRYFQAWRERCPLQILTTEAFLARIPIVRPDSVGMVVEDTSALKLDAHRLLENYRRRISEHGGLVVTSSRVDRLERKEGVWHIGCGDREFQADIVVNAAGAWADEVAGMAGLQPLGLTPHRRTALLVDPGVPFGDWPLVHRAEGDLYFKPEAGLLMVSPADETPSPPCDAQPEELDVAIALDRFQSITTSSADRPQHAWAGLRTFMPDRLPVVGLDTREDGFFWLAGQGGFGMQTSPAMAELAAALIRGEEPAIASRLKPDRVVD
ncbi:MAG: FAD-binding oxidoreductase [Pseudomonadales bacterium]|nr:FAD-binding oxidoreductase [Pseudomonadales bacterium]MDP6470099.1 FAD-binding oxidoreductase [Pseudomonadales bacterium]MDP6827002.1 FAD-binding oxidoreductase [Pseudomonadales bacterium]MDP6972060.1 FAD-binding oxidoreductase [Pseudomonadales bacterium]